MERKVFLSFLSFFRTLPYDSSITSGLLFLIGYVLLALGMFQNNGHFDVRALILILLSFICVLRGIVLMRGKNEANVRMPTIGALALALAFLLYQTTLKEPGIYLLDHLYSAKVILSASVLILAIITLYIFSTQERPHARRIFFWVAVALAFILRYWMLTASPHPSIDVFTNITSGVHSFLAGHNPYLTPDSLDYLPANLYLHLLPGWLFGDVRAVYILAELITLLSLICIKTRTVSMEQKSLIGLLFLYHPRSLFVLEQAWLDPLILMLLSLFLVLHERKLLAVSSAIFGYMISMKQYLVFLPIHYIILDRNIRRFSVVIGIALLTVLPFVIIMGPKDFFQLAVLPLVSTPFRPDGLTVPAFFVNVFHTRSVTSVWSLGIGSITTLITLLLLKNLAPTVRFLAGSLLTMFAIFLFGAQAFCNYYYLVGGMLLWLLLLHAEPEHTSQKTCSSEPEALIG